MATEIDVTVNAVTYRVVGDYYGATPGTRTCPPTPADFDIEEASVVDDGGTVTPLPYSLVQDLYIAGGTRLLRALERAAVVECERKLREDGEI